ncbi:MAG: site-specific integrase [Proteobacteria bacterium]|nr:MAG: site-specific integrase [Pseudomonadota bacterium]
MRRGELCGLKWDRIDLVRNQIVISRSLSRYGLSESTKSGKKRFVPINSVMKDLLRSLMKEQRGEFVFSDAEGRSLDVHHMYRDFRAAQTRAGFTRRIRFHDLRHTFASHFMMNGGNIYDLQKILGHSSLEMTQRYAHMSPDHLAQAIQIVSFTPKVGGNVISLANAKTALGVG